MAGIVGYGVYIPSYRIKVEEIAKVWGDNAQAVSRGLVVNEKSVPAPDEDTATISVEAARNSLKRAGIDPQKIGAVYVGSESHPYAVKPTATIVAEAVEASPDLTAADLEFACKAGTAGMQICMGLVDAGNVEYGLAVGADTAQGAPSDALEYTASAGGAAYIIGKENTIADFEGTYSFTTDTPDFYRREGKPYPRHGGRFTGEPAYFKHVLAGAKGMMEKMGTEASDYDHAVFHQPNGKFYIRAAKKLGFTEEQYKTGLLTPVIGNTYSGATPLGLAAILDIAQPGERIFAVSYGSGAGSDAFSITVNEQIEEKRDLAPKVKDMIKNKEYVNYAIYAKFKGKMRMAGLTPR
ncbi:hydroxymethylglutaryl-CoA synthase [Methanobacterium sp. MZ-A1]|uniref:Hydroxymethylglutaryl-CoA synthase n=1 Tax=Methanobacterium subterraneum TaxID=59277 RepID=A0A2H4VER4_9EURY|nr:MULTISPECIES: hydroxymethylglutaryl-CoA synthase [Methanobacterium]MBW4257234.1 hydroxymethylglutaryl-CoA synthase [Methanobacterium sp. YSL]PKL74027.1 MAG: hydroxymethylglutaryl-CoA synthase [Methanobacteriales archaeon HGW-Methanobacteriales-2]AUB56576.1 hydroxymethylglutaryl-CoA synthase [Methanobacterium subterraneum]AUB58431.1 hydroxymethylglutaryl-CoA synthase [Methanobacterium sp. MZ-A1]AUB59550.1 hydroxymethylglutaryl-CoA synthase [Methanobacterium subterraneum]